MKGASVAELLKRFVVPNLKFSPATGKVRRSGYVLEWFIGDHEPRHVHVYDAKGRQIGRLDIDRMVGVQGWMPVESWLSSSEI